MIFLVNQLTNQIFHNNLCTAAQKTVHAKLPLHCHTSVWHKVSDWYECGSFERNPECLSYICSSMLIHYVGIAANSCAVKCSDVGGTCLCLCHFVCRCVTWISRAVTLAL